MLPIALFLLGALLPAGHAVRRTACLRPLQTHRRASIIFNPSSFLRLLLPRLYVCGSSDLSNASLFRFLRSLAVGRRRRCRCRSLPPNPVKRSNYVGDRHLAERVLQRSLGLVRRHPSPDSIDLTFVTAETGERLRIWVNKNITIRCVPAAHCPDTRNVLRPPRSTRW